MTETIAIRRSLMKSLFEFVEIIKIAETIDLDITKSQPRQTLTDF